MKLSPPIRPFEAASAAIGSLREPKRTHPLLRRLRPWRWFGLLVLLPTLVTGLYFAVWAADIYESEARFVVRGRQAAMPAAPIASLLSGGMRPVSEETQAVLAFVDSHDAVATLRQTLDLPAIWRRPEADLLARLWYEAPEAERLLRYWRSRVRITLDEQTGISVLRVQAFRPDDAQAIAARLLDLSEEVVNRLSARSQADTLRVAREEVAIAERRVMAAREALTGFRERERAIDPARAAAAALEMVGQLEAQLVQARAEVQERQAFMRPDNPQMQMLRNRIAALSERIAAERQRLTTGAEALPQQLSAYERLQIERGFADQALTSALASLEVARAEAVRQQVFLMRVVEPNLAERATYPLGLYNTATVFLALTLLYGIGWLIIAGAREHAS